MSSSFIVTKVAEPMILTHHSSLFSIQYRHDPRHFPHAWRYCAQFSSHARAQSANKLLPGSLQMFFPFTYLVSLPVLVGLYTTPDSKPNEASAAFYEVAILHGIYH
ncbi:hypothetical protein Moror_564 [Moniliophthora roreri MCA 2997]|uniref:Uncharacterized protein n=1 Tax=Moniliophthora roreri (strain MCA 2997) TaxID=1381753 RepID=V2WD82_MONRO|nr:hypothetical protein Moror_564 [Moniliophthora roreri MCA 2997]KAI3595006.1 hypothetical protein WG66_002391 [Moniliophthora roreri]